jgi:hypothetical protein
LASPISGKNIADLRRPCKAGRKLWISPHGIVDIRKSIVDIRKSIVDIRKSIVDIRKLNPAAVATASRKKRGSMPSKRLAAGTKMAPMASRL